MRNFVKPGEVLTATAAADVKSGEFVKIGAIFGVASTNAKAGDVFELVTGRVYDLPKTSAQAWAFGDVIYATAAGVMTTVATDNTKVGVAVEVAANPSGTGRVRLNDNF